MFCCLFLEVSKAMLKQKKKLARLPEHLKFLWLHKPLGFPMIHWTCSKNKSSLKHVQQLTLDPQDMKT